MGHGVDAAGDLRRHAHVGVLEGEARVGEERGDVLGIACREVVQAHHRVTAPQERFAEM